MSDKNIKQNIRLIPIDPEDKHSGALAKNVHCKCEFCNKTSLFDSFSIEICERMSGNSFYCPFCLRNGYDKKNNKHILILSFKAIYAHWFYKLHKGRNEIWLSEIKDQLKKHEAVGLMNPAFNYDPETFLWFIDFSKVGKGKRVKLSEVLFTVDSMMPCFGLEKHVSLNSIKLLRDKYRDAIEKFHSKRYRPKNRPQLIPTLSLAGQSKSSSSLRNFSMDNLKIKL